MATALAAINGLPEMAGEAIAEKAFPGNRRGMNRVKHAAMKEGVARLVDEATQAVAWQENLTTAVAALRIAALAACPNLGRHPSLKRECGKPLEEDLRDEMLTRWPRGHLVRVYGVHLGRWCGCDTKITTCG